MSTFFSPDASPITCAECEQPATNPAFSRAGASLCAECVAAYYVACSGCGALVARDESLARENLACCQECFSTPVDAAGGGTVDETIIESLIAEYVALHAEEKRIGQGHGVEVAPRRLTLRSTSSRSTPAATGRARAAGR